MPDFPVLPALPVRLAQAYRTATLLLALTLPAAALAYLLSLPTVGRFEHHLFHVVLITTGNAIAVGATLLAWANYRATGEPALRAVTLALGAFAAIYVWHGLLTPLGATNPTLFLAYGPTARFVFLAYLLLAALQLHAPADPPERRAGGWWPHLAGVAAIDAGVLGLAALGVGMPTFRLLEIASIGLTALVVVAFLTHGRKRSGLLATFAASLVLAAQASVTFLFAKPWDHVWWLAHATFAAGFLVLGLGMVRSYLTTRSVREIFSEQDLFARLRGRTEELEAANIRLREANASLARKNEALESFSFVVSHDLKEPVRALDSLNEALRADYGGQLPPDGREALRLQGEAARHLSALLTGLLEVSRASRLDPSECHPVWVAETLQRPECRGRYEGLLRERGAEVEISTLVATPPVFATPAALCQILGNLIVNAVRHNPKVGPRVRVRIAPADAEGLEVEVVVEDNGPGFPPSAAARFRQRELRTLREGGFGLLIVRRAVEGLGGRIRLEKSAEMGGAAVHVILPAASGEARRGDRPRPAATGSAPAPGARLG